MKKLLTILTYKKIYIAVAIVVLIFVIVSLFSNKTNPPSIQGTDPVDGETDVIETKQISINFNPDISDSVKNKISVSIKPDTSFDSTWLSNTFKIVPKAPLANNQKYELTVKYSSKDIYNFSFETSIFSKADKIKYGSLQSQMDYTTGQVVKKVVDQYPWYPSLPIKTKNYVIYYDFQQQKFAITFLVTGLTNDQQNTFIAEALQYLRSIGVKDPIQYYVNQP